MLKHIRQHFEQVAPPEIAQAKVTEVEMRHETSSLGLFRLMGLNNCAILEDRNFTTLHTAN